MKGTNFFTIMILSLFILEKFQEKSYANIEFDDSKCEKVYRDFEFCSMSFFEHARCVEDLLIGEYTSNLYKDLNISLRDTSDQGFCKKINQELIHYLINQKNPFKGVVYSGQNLPNEFKEKNLKQKQCYQMGHYLSTSKNSEVALKFANNYATTFIMKFHSKNGSFIQEYSYIRAEEEVLFPPGTVLQYVGQNPIYYNKNSRKYNSPDGAREASELIPLLDFNEVKDSEIGSVCGVKSKSKIKKVFLFDM